MKKRVTLSLCMIVKDEERTLERCLNSVKSFINEIIIVDTGSKEIFLLEKLLVIIYYG